LRRTTVVTVKLATACSVLAMVLLGAGSGDATAQLTPALIVTVVRHGGLCATGTECREVLRITKTTISGTRRSPRRLQRSERDRLVRAIRTLDLASIRAHPFTGTCPVAYDGTESIYRFRGVSLALASCTYDLRQVQAVRLTERLLATLRPR